MKTILFQLLFALGFATSLFAQEAKTLNIDAENSNIHWIGKKVTGAHDGNLKLSEGNLELKDNEITAGTFTIDMNTITVLDISSAKSNASLVGHLKNEDFFDVEKFPTASITIEKASVASTKAATSKKLSAVVEYDIEASITIKGITKPIEFVALGEFLNSGGARFTADLEIDRTEFDIHYGADKSLGDRMIYKKFTLEVSLSLN